MCFKRSKPNLTRNLEIVASAESLLSLASPYSRQQEISKDVKFAICTIRQLDKAFQKEQAMFFSHNLQANRGKDLKNIGPRWIDKSASKPYQLVEDPVFR